MSSPMTSSPTSSTVSIPESQLLEIEIRPLAARDIPSVIELHSELLPYVSYPPAFFRQSLLLADRVCLVAYAPDSPDTPVAVISAFNNHAKVEVLTVAVQPQYQRRGLGSRLIKQAVTHLMDEDEDTEVTAQASTANEAACGFYEGLGLSHDGHIIRDAYRKSSAGWRDAYRYAGRI